MKTSVVVEITYNAGRLIPMVVFLLCASVSCIYHPDAYPLTESNEYYGGGDGLSYETAVFFPGAKSNTEAKPLKDRWLNENFPGYKQQSQGIVFHKNKSYDRVRVLTADGEEKSIYFDMTPQVGMRSLF